MRNTNRLLIRLNKAVEASNSKYISEKALAIIFFDNLIETRNKKNEFEDIKSFINRYHKKYPNWINIDKIRKRLIDFDDYQKIKSLKTILKLRLESLICIMILMTLCVILMAIFNIYMISTVGNKYKI